MSPLPPITAKRKYPSSGIYRGGEYGEMSSKDSKFQLHRRNKFKRAIMYHSDYSQHQHIAVPENSEDSRF
jgi:hypothetical protein